MFFKRLVRNLFPNQHFDFYARKKNALQSLKWVWPITILGASLKRMQIRKFSYGFSKKNKYIYCTLKISYSLHWCLLSQTSGPQKDFSIQFRKLTWACSGFDIPVLWLVQKTRFTISTNQMKSLHQLCLGHSRLSFLALWAVCVFLLLLLCDRVYATAWNWGRHKSTFLDYFCAISKIKIFNIITSPEIEWYFQIHDYYKLNKGKNHI